MKKLRYIFCVGLAAMMILSAAACNKAPQEQQDAHVNIDAYTVSYTEYPLFANGTSKYRILLPAQPSAAEQYAAEELSSIFEESTGKPLPIENEGGQAASSYISIGDTKAAEKAGIAVSEREMGNGGFVIRTEGENCFINANTEAGKIYGALFFAEKNLGYMYYSEDEIRYTRYEDVMLGDFDLVYKPSFDGRNVYSYDTLYNSENAVHLRVNGVVSSWDEKFGEASMWSSLHDMSNVFQLLYVKDYYNDHNGWFYLSPQYRDTDFSQMTDNECYTIVQKHSQLCYTEGYYEDDEGGMFDTFVQNLIGYIQREPDAKLFMLGMGDNEYFCDCDRCREDVEKYKESGVMIRFVNKVAKEIKRWLKEESGTPDREIYLVAFAYLTVMEPPVKYENRQPIPIDESVVAEDNVCIRIAPLTNSNFYWTIDDADHNTFMRNNIAGWQQIASNFSIWDYRVYYHNVVAPYPYWNTVKTNLQVYKDMNVIDVYHQGIAQTSGVPFGRMDDYVRSRLLYNLDADVNALMNDFIDAYYKQAAPYIREYLAYLRTYYENHVVPAGYSGSVYTTVFTTEFWSLECLLSIKNIFDKAYESISGLPEEEFEKMKGRIDVESRFYRFGLLELYSSYFTKDEIAQMIDDWEQANVFNPLMQNEVRVDISTKVDEWKALLK